MTDLDKLIAAAVAVAEAMPPEERAAMMEAQRQSWARGEAALAETSTSPPRVEYVSKDEAGALHDAMKASSALVHGGEIERLPGQPMTDALPGEPAISDHAGFLDALADTNMPLSGIVPRLRLAAAEIRRLRADIAAMNDFVDRTLDDLSTARVDGNARYRAGIEAAAKYHDDQAAEWSEHYTKNGNDPSAREYAKQHSADAAAIRALADKPAPDAARKGG